MAMRKVFSICGFVIGIFLVCILAFNIIFIIRSHSDSDKIPSVLGYTPLIVQSGSMEPALNIGDLIFIKKSPVDKLHMNEADGDIITFRSGDSVITHRAIESNHDEYGNIQVQTRGDANNTADIDYVYEEDIVGVYRGRIAYLGSIILFLQTPAGMLILIVIPLCILFFLEGKKFRKRQKSDRAKVEALEEQLAGMHPNRENLDDSHSQT